MGVANPGRWIVMFLLSVSPCLMLVCAFPTLEMEVMIPITSILRMSSAHNAISISSKQH
jgi:hypothetical protein